MSKRRSIRLQGSSGRDPQKPVGHRRGPLHQPVAPEGRHHHRQELLVEGEAPPDQIVPQFLPDDAGHQFLRDRLGASGRSPSRSGRGTPAPPHGTASRPTPARARPSARSRRPTPGTVRQDRRSSRHSDRPRRSGRRSRPARIPAPSRGRTGAGGRRSARSRAAGGPRPQRGPRSRCRPPPSGRGRPPPGERVRQTTATSPSRERHRPASSRQTGSRSS